MMANTGNPGPSGVGSNSFIDRGARGYTPAVTSRSDEAFLDYISELRNFAQYGPSTQIRERAGEHLERSASPLEFTSQAVAEVRQVVTRDPDIAAWLRVKRSAQAAFWERIVESYGRHDDTYLDMLDRADACGPGKVTWDPDFQVPEYAAREMHLQPGGFVGHKLAGLHHDYGSRVFFGGADDSDQMHKGLAERTSIPLDGEVDRILDLGCSEGKLTCAMKLRFPAATVCGIDISAPMVRYAHLRAIRRDLDVDFAQMAAERLSLSDDSVDLATAFILFHEIPVPVIRRTLEEVFRVLRPGGSFVVWDIPTGKNPILDYTGFFGLLDGADNCEPYAPGFAVCGLEQMAAGIGFFLRHPRVEDQAKFGRVFDKPANSEPG